MNIHEYQAKELLAKNGLNVPAGKVAYSSEEAVQIANDLQSEGFVVKAQIHAGGRGKGGGVKLAPTTEDVGRLASDIIGMNLVTHQTGPEGKLVGKVLIEEASQIEKEFYLGMVIDRSEEKIVVMASPEGGVEIEEVAKHSPEKIIKEYVDISVGLLPFQGRKIAYFLGLKGKTANKAVSMIVKLYEVFVSSDCSLAEINPMILTKSGDVIPLDAKLNIDDNALYRHKDLEQYHDPDEEDPTELEAKEWGISYVKLDGNIGCLVNGAGLAMSTMDIIKYHGGEPANFLDVGGGASPEQVTQAFKMILSDSNVKAIFVNIFGGIMKCDTIAMGIISAAKEVGIEVPLVVRLEGTNVELGREMLSDSGLNIITGKDMKECAAKVFEAAQNS
ncbi:MAG: ADP-forming succinate--CoA ligase subunit beta [Candidatus Dadabacteria bacterium]|nr:ADP-forming succinate--CoA ligase subunit beta [Candidatus Dadabacteria bacterium]NIS09416.1 ADP-forming succinate--CoA ligase subunit beta [Candidatus Dadabacteria bacterium]NIV42567.1 ADP-forming succinate--CoA ligase subunit beta [Candidatus Dadabacteria bacterium]NIY22654.1 ADP-forming succinate--CoA ligase subunit beta [Candidatus Dadabacteria bacterium]